MNAARSARQAINTKNLVDLSLKDDELYNNEDASSIIDHLLAASEANLKKRDDQNYISSFLQELLPAADEKDIEDHKNEEVLINKTIEFVNKTMNEKILSKMLSKTKKTHYTAVLYFLWLLLDEELIPLSLRGKLLTKSPLHDEFVSLQLTAYLRTQKFKATPELTVRRWMHKLGFRYQCYQKGIYRWGEITLLNKNDLKIAQLDQLMSKWLDQDCRIRTFLQLNDDEKEHVWVTHDERLEPSMHISDFLTETIGPLKDDQKEARVIMVLGCVGLFAFNNATSHTAFAKNALVISKMNLSPGGSAPKIRDTIWNND
ncbi:3897_t:CDS:2, partial [Cetraspora pellucida]